MTWLRVRSGVLACGLALAASGPAQAGDPRQPTVVELFTSQSCSSCPPANANLITLAERPDVLALSYAVTYWNHLDWEDTFSRPEFTARQRAYAPALGHDAVFTPQMVVNGRADAIGNRLEPVEALIAANALAGPPEVRVADGRVAIGAGDAPAGGADVWLVRYDPNRVEVPVGSGENGGRTLPHSHVVRGLARIGGWDGAPTTLALPAAPDGLRTAILVQSPEGGPILAAATDEG
ncbi:DUF1223 domain-containing protein [Marinivivus vitaminiproducens]|uniref:DUF1223 domain-containing protein n=1 Tax=Marinivivus vitaminiproducens TaxID=3035935 RepID=UPI00279D0195|nr:DUF1223 domain-containing protein [Geminicoccaceae bacterium SCSIO 64248]